MKMLEPTKMLSCPQMGVDIWDVQFRKEFHQSFSGTDLEDKVLPSIKKKKKLHIFQPRVSSLGSTDMDRSR